MPKKEWFAEWFDSPYYHLLYQNRNDEEASGFIKNLCTHLELPIDVEVLDLACGKGRHSITLANLGYRVTGADLAANSIQIAQKNQADLALHNLSFIVHDMRQVIPSKHFGAIFNLFTSFGYFEELLDNHRVCDAIAQMLDPDGILVIDFLNAPKTISKLVAAETIERGNIRFDIKRRYTKGHIYKQITILDPQHPNASGPFTERVQALEFADFQALLAPHFTIKETFGSYQLEAFDPDKSERLIIIAKRKA